MVILFDGVCNLCNGFVQFILKRDRKWVFQFASLQSTYGTDVIKHFDLPQAGPGTIVLYDNGKILTESDAVIKIASSLGGMWKCFMVFKIVPPFMRNACYRWVACNRYKMFGKKDQCMVPNENVKDRFLDNVNFNATNPL